MQTGWPAEASPLRSSEPQLRKKLEGEAEAELTPERAGNDRACRVDKANRMAEGGRVPDVGTIVVAVVGTVGEIEGLANDLQIVVIAELNVLGQTQIQLEERIAPKRIEFSDGAAQWFP